MTHALVIQHARAWIGTPYLHQAAVKGVGCDCLGLLRGVWREIYGSEPEAVPPYTPDWSEPQQDEVLMRAAMRHMRITKGPLAVGQVLLFRMQKGAVAKHIGLVAQCGAHPTFIHSYAGHGVVESPLSDPWRRKIAAQFEFLEG